jgi:hypothetical protein
VCYFFFQFDQAGLTLDSYDEYNSSDAEKFHQAFLDFAVAVGKLLGGDNSTSAKMEAVYNFEKQMAGVGNRLLFQLTCSPAHLL